MKEQNSNSYRSTLYLDIDGVIFPGHCQDFDYHDLPNASLEREWVSPTEFYHPEVVEVLGRVAVDSLVVLSSSRMVGFLQDPMYKDVVQKLGIKGALFIDLLRPAAIDIKLDAVRRHWSGVGSAGLGEELQGRSRGRAFSAYGIPVTAQGERAVLVDDHAGEVSGDKLQVLRKLTELSGVTVFAPNTSFGLTLEGVAGIGKAL